MGGKPGATSQSGMTDVGAGSCGDGSGSVVLSCSAETGDGKVSTGSSAMLPLLVADGYTPADVVDGAGARVGTVDDDAVEETDASRRVPS